MKDDECAATGEKGIRLQIDSAISRDSQSGVCKVNPRLAFRFEKTGNFSVLAN
jgi:hypothetical protein